MENDEVHFIAANSNPKIPVVQEGFPAHTGNSAIAQHSINDLYTPHHCFCSLAEPGCVNKGISGKRVPACWVVLLNAVDAAFINQRNLVLYNLSELLRVCCVLCFLWIFFFLNLVHLGIFSFLFYKEWMNYWMRSISAVLGLIGLLHSGIILPFVFHLVFILYGVVYGKRLAWFY